MAAEIRVFSPEQAFTLNRFQRVASLYTKLDTSLRAGTPTEVTHDERGNQLRTHAEDTQFKLVFDAQGVYGVYKIRRGLRKQMEAQGMGDIAEEIVRSYNEHPTDTQIRDRVMKTGDY